MSQKRNVFDIANEWIRGVESSAVNLGTAIAPWGAPLPVVYMSFQHMRDFLAFPWFISFPVAAVIEILGFATISTGLALWMHNRKYQDDKKKAPLWIVFISFGFYIIIIFSMNVLIDATQGTIYAKNAELIVRAMLTLMTIPAALLLAVRTQHNALIVDLDRAREDRKKGNLPKVSDISERTAADWRRVRPTLSIEDVAFTATAPIELIIKRFPQYKLEDRTARNWKKYAIEEAEKRNTRQQ